MASNRPGIITVQQMVGLCCSLPCLLLLIPRYGVAGAATSVLISTAVRFLFAMTSFTRRFGGRPPSLLMNGDSIRWIGMQMARSFPVLAGIGVGAHVLPGEQP